MAIGFTEEQELLRETARRFLENECDARFLRQRIAERAAVTDEFWGSCPNRVLVGLYGVATPIAAGQLPSRCM